MMTLGDFDSEKLGKLVGTVVIVGAILVYCVSRIVKGFWASNRGTRK